MEGVMMRGPVSWAVAVRKPGGDIAVEAHPLTGPRSPLRTVLIKLPFVRGIFVLFESLRIGMKALKISAHYALEARSEESPRGEEEPSEKVEHAIGWSMGIALVVFSGIFIAFPAIISKWGGSRLGVGGDLQQNLAEGAIRVGFFVGYILLISLIPDIRRVFQYHGAEHKTIYAYENDDPFEPEVIDRYPTLHVRCGTNFLFIVMFLTILGHFVLDVSLTAAGSSDVATRVLGRILMIPVLAGASYEVIRAAGRKGDSHLLHAVSLPGLALQRITTKPPTHEQIEVAVKAMEAVIARQALAEPSPAAEPLEIRAPSILHPQPDPATPN